ncbi:hypothetical protein BRC62_06005 [Halobacteriales archaeon QH_10_67_13]|nr:MAG: hypothetical protein BRC62_06005 [Halobacteriales archaeon QH_10_67_13]
MTPLSVLPLVVVASALGAYVGGKLSRRIDRRLDRVATALFGDLIERDTDRESRIRSAYIEASYRSYAAKTLLFAALALVAGAVAGAYLVPRRSSSVAARSSGSRPGRSPTSPGGGSRPATPSSASGGSTRD